MTVAVVAERVEMELGKVGVTPVLIGEHVHSPMNTAKTMSTDVRVAAAIVMFMKILLKKRPDLSRVLFE